MRACVLASVCACGCVCVCVYVCVSVRASMCESVRASAYVLSDLQISVSSGLHHVKSMQSA